MNKVIRFIIILLLLCGFCTISYAEETGTVYLESNRDVVEKGEEIEITVNVKNSEIAACNFSISFDEAKWEYVSELENANKVENHILFVWYDTTGGRSAKQGEIAKFKFKAKEDGLSTFTIDGEFYTSLGQTIKMELQEKQVLIGKEDTKLQGQEDINLQEDGINSQADNANLQVLRLDREGITPSFDTNILEYYLTIPNDVKEIEVLAISENSEATIKVTGNTNLKKGLNTIKVQVTSEDKSQKKTYTIQVTKTENLLLANTDLEILAIENALLTPPFDASQTYYQTEVAKDTQDLNVFSVPKNENAKVEVKGENNLKEGNNTITVVVTAANGFSKKKYQVQVYKRNEAEQIKYEEEQKEQVKKVEEAYEIEKLSSSQNQENNESQRNNENRDTERKDNKVCIIGIVAILLVGIAIGGFVWWKRRK